MTIHLFKNYYTEEYENEYNTGRKDEDGRDIYDYDYDETTIVVFYCLGEDSDYSDDDYSYDLAYSNCVECRDQYAMAMLANVP